MSITSIFLAGQAGLSTAQTQLRVAGDNIANINTPGYARKIANQESVVVAGMGLGARITSVTRAADQFLQKAALAASGRAGQTGVMADFLDQAQSLFGDPSETSSSFFSGLDDVYAAFSTASESPSSSLGRNAAIVSINNFLDDSTRIASGLSALQAETDRQVTSKVSRVNEILTQIAQTNVDVSRASVMGGDTSGAENIQSQLLDELSGLMAIQVSGRTSGGVTVRSADGAQLAGDGGASQVTYTKVNGVGVLTSTPPHGVAQSVVAGGGEIDGLLQIGKTELPKLSEQLSEFVSKAVDELNRVHNANSAAPAPAQMVGRDTGLDATSAITGFTGKTTVALVDGQGALTRKIDIDFGAKSISVNGGVAVIYSTVDPTDFFTRLSTAMGGTGSASFANGAMTLANSAGGVVISDDPAAPSQKVGKGFSHYFGMNDAITSDNITDYNTGLTGTSPHGFTPNEVLSLQLTDSSGNLLRGVNVTVPAAGDMNSLLATMNSSVGLYGSFSLDGNGRMSFTAAGNSDVQVSVASDNTHRGGTGPSISELFGIGSDVKTARTSGFAIRQDISLNYDKLAFAQFDRAAVLGGTAISTGDGRGALALARAGSNVTSFAAAGDLRAVQMSVLSYASELSGSIGSKASAAKDRKDSADAVSSEADTRRASVEGVNMDEELINLTTYQQAYNASARVIQAAKDIYDILLNMVD